MLILKKSNRFEKAFRKVSQYRNFRQEKYEYAVSILISGLDLPKSFKDHELLGNKKGERECHIAPDILLIYKIEKDILILELLDIGSHSNLFK